jgi:hypothetical protein
MRQALYCRHMISQWFSQYGDWTWSIIAGIAVICLIIFFFWSGTLKGEGTMDKKDEVKKTEPPQKM